MSKGIKIFFRILLGALGGVLGLLVAASLLLQLPSVQTWAVQRVTAVLSERIGTRVSVERVRLRFVSRAQIEGLYIADFQGDTMLYAARVEAGVNHIARWNIALGNVTLDGARFHMRQVAPDSSNFEQLLARLRSDKPSEGGFRLTANGLIINDFRYTYRRLAPAAKQGLNFDDLDVELGELRASQIDFGGDSLALRVERLALWEQSGLRIENFAAKRIGVGLTSGHIAMEELELRTPESRATMPYLRLSGEKWADYGDFIHAVRIEGALENTTLGLATLGRFAPSLAGREQVYRRVSASFAGSVADLGGQLRHIEVAAGTTLDDAKFRLSGLPDIAATRLEIDLARLATNGEDVQFLMGDITGKPLPAKTASMLRNAGQITLTGRFSGLLEAFDAAGELRSAVGDADFDMAISGQERLDGTFAAREIRLGTLLSNPALGNATLHGRVSGTLGAAMELDADATLQHLHYRGYDYRDIALDGRITADLFRGRVTSADPNLRFDFDGLVGYGEVVPRLDFRLDLHRADLAATHLNRRDSVSVLSARVTAALSASSLDNANGRVEIHDARYISPVDTLSADDITLLAQNSASSKLLSLRSSLANATFRSRSSYRHLLDYLGRVMQAYLPTLAAATPPSADTAVIAADDDYYLLRLQLGRAGGLVRALLPGLLVAPGTELSLMLNPTARQLSLSAHSQYIEWQRYFVSNLALSSRGAGDSLSLFLNADQLFAAGILMPDFALQAGLRDDRATLSAGYADTLNHVAAQLAATARLQKNADSLLQIALQLQPSSLSMRDQRWMLGSGEITLDTARIAVERLVVASTGGQLMAWGALARGGADTLHVAMRNFSLAPLTPLLGAQQVALAGLANGHADIASPLGAGMLSGDITLDSLRVNAIALPPLGVTARWELQHQRAGMTLTDRASSDTLIRAFYSPATRRYGAEVNLRGIDLSLLDPFLEGVLHSSRGRADVALRLGNPDGVLDLRGEVLIPELTTTLAFTGVPYNLAGARVRAEGSRFTLDPTSLRDPEGNAAPLTALFELSPNNYHYTLGLRPANLLVLNTTPADNELFNGRVYASGSATIRGDAHAVRMNIAATTAPRSNFAMSLSSRGQMAAADFITYIAPDRPLVDSSWFERRKRLLMAGEKSARSTPSGTSLGIDMTLAVRDNADFSLVVDPRMGRGIRARGTGNLSLSLDPRTRELSLYGDYALAEGSYNLNLEQLVDRTFTIQPGSMIRWTGDPAGALLDVTASYRLKTSLSPLVGGEGPLAATTTSVDCIISLTDNLLNPTIGFDVQVPDGSVETQSVVRGALATPETMSTQFLWLVAFNSFYSDNSAAQIGTMSGSATVFDFLTGQLSNMLSSEKFNIGLRYRPAGDDSSDEFGVNFSWSLAQNRLLLDVEGNYDTQNNAAAMRQGSSLTGDFAVRYLVDRSGNVQAKIFSRTIDTYDENQGLQETGVGLYYHEDFDNVGDIVRNMRARFARRKTENRKPKTEK